MFRSVEMKKMKFKTQNKTEKRIRAGRALAGILSVFLLAETVILPSGRTVSALAGGIPEEELSIVDTSVDAMEGNEAKSIVTVAPEGLTLTSESVILMETESGTVIAEKEADKARPIASVTKIMTLLLIAEAVDTGKIKLTDTITVSEYAASMGGSQVFLEPGETQNVETMMKCISISSANDACVAMAEHLAGSEAAFVERMNTKAKELGMNHTTFHNCCGLDVTGHVSCARDVALMSAELMKNHPWITKYTTTWMDTIIHTTRRGSSEFGLANTNKLLKQYNGITGLKTGSTDEAKYCLSATAERNGVKLVAVVLAAPDTKTRFREAAALLDYGFAKCTVYRDEGTDFPLTEVEIKNGREKTVTVGLKSNFSRVFTSGEDLSAIKREIVLKDEIKAPLAAGDTIGEYRYTLNGTELGSVDIICKEEVKEMSFGASFLKCKDLFFGDKGVKQEPVTEEKEPAAEEKLSLTPPEK
ncbi:MAG: D-alanyl-D-alanine carboxypeptidase [Lachnospiraceae bacterium]|nr:D-alanyl-D-alanine carboxypeptidase [Lachnospiraceae bacterium]